MQPWSVLTGDFIKSTTVPPTQIERSFDIVALCAQSLRAFTTQTIALSPRGGDGWQLALGEPRLALRATALITARLKADPEMLQTRIAIGAGLGNLPSSLDTNAAQGPAFIASGRLLETLPKKRRISHAGTGAPTALYALLDHLMLGWTSAQAAAVAELLGPNPGPRAAAADRLGKSRQAVDQALRGAGFAALSDAIDACERDAEVS